jgi:hypothetical protein
MMAKFDEEKFRAAAKAAGYGDDEIDAEVKIAKAPAGAAVPNMAPIADGRETTAAFEKEAQEKGAELIKEAKQEQQKTLTEPAFDFMKAINSPVGYVTGAAALAALTAGAGYALGKARSSLSGINSRKIGQKPEIDRTIDIPMDSFEKKVTNPFPDQLITTGGNPPVFSEPTTGQPPLSQRIAEFSMAQERPNPFMAAPDFQPAPSQFDKSKLGESPDPLANRGYQQPPQAIAPTPSVQESVETGNTSKAVQAVVAQELDKATGVAPTLASFNRDANGNIDYPKGMSKAARQGAEAFAQQYPDQAKALATEGRFGILGAGSGDNNLFNSYGSDMMKRIRNEVNEGQMVGPYGNYETKINPAIKAISPETAIGKDLAQLREAQIGGNFGTLGTPATIGGKKGGLITGPNLVPKAIKAGGPAMLLMAISDAAKAAQQGNYGEAAVRSADVATDYMPMISQLKQGLSPREAGAPTVSKQTIESSALLGSPYAQTEWAKSQRQKDKAGAGRGIAPPSAYMR